MLTRVLIFWISLLPFVVWKGFYEGPKVAYFFVGSSAIFLFWIVRFSKTGYLFKLGKADFWYLLWLLALLVSSLIGIHPLESVLGGSYRHQGVIFFFALWVLGKTVSILGKNQKQILVRWLGIGVIVQSVIVASQFVLGKLYFGRPLGTLGEPNAVAGYLVMGAYLVSKIVPVTAIFVTGSRTGILSLVAVLNLKNRFLTFLIFAVCLVLIFFVSQKRAESAFESRTLFWKIAMENIMKKPILGYGAESGEYIYEKSYLEYKMPLEGVIVDRSHNLFLDITLWGGVVGLVFFLGFLYQVRKKSIILPFLIFSFFQPLSVVHWVLLMALLNVSFAYDKEKGSYNRNHRPRRIISSRISSQKRL